MAGEKTDFGASSLSSVGEIARCADFSAGGFSATEALGGLVNNREFARGFVDYVNGRQTSQAYVWRCLSAVGEDIGETLFKNVEKYVDFVSNVETCKVTSLRSMMS